MKTNPRVLRGGSWYNSARSLRSAYRTHWVPANRYGDAGFRLIREKKEYDKQDSVPCFNKGNDET